MKGCVLVNKSVHLEDGYTQIEFQIDDDVIDESAEEVITYKYSITSYGADYPVDSLVKRLKQGVIFIPNFQRSYVWNINQASRFIESLILGLPVPGIFLSKESETQKLLVIDGQQRLKTLQFFYDGIFNGKEFTLKGVQKNLEGKTYKTLDAEDRIRLDDSILHATIVKQDEPSDDESSIYHIFERLNTGGTLLQPQEIRACIYHGEFNELLNELSNYKSWKAIYGATSKRLKDQELILRFLALYFNYNNYKKPLKEFLNKYMAANRHLNKQSEKEIKDVFFKTIDFIADAIGKRAFRLKQGIVAALFDAITVGTARRLERGKIEDVGGYEDRYNSLLENSSFIDACKSGTSDESTVESRIQIATKAFEDLV